MKVIDLLNKIANGEEVPKKIKYIGKIYEYVEEMKWYLRDDMKCELSNSKKCLNDEVEIIEEEKKIPEKNELLDYITNLQQENKRLKNMLEQADNKNLELIEIINEIYDVIEDKNITGIETRLKIQEILESKGE